MWETQIAKAYASARVQVGQILQTKYLPKLLCLYFQTIYGGTNEIMKELGAIKDNLRSLLDENDRVTDIEKLDRDEFVIDVAKKTNREKQGDDLCSDIRKKCEVTSLTM